MTKAKITQVLPRGRRIPHLKASDEIDAKLTAIAQRAYDRTQKKKRQREMTGDEGVTDFAVCIASVVAARAASNYVSEKHFETELPRFRNLVSGKREDGELRRAIEALEPILLRSDDALPFSQMRALFCYGDPNSIGLESNNQEVIEQQIRNEDLWEDRLSPAAIRGVLRQWLLLMDQLHEMSGIGRTPVTAETNFVAELASYWNTELKVKPINSRGEAPGENQEGVQTGLFSDFVRTAGEIIPEDYRPKSWDTPIRNFFEG
jgi:hypothetical protein